MQKLSIRILVCLYLITACNGCKNHPVDHKDGGPTASKTTNKQEVDRSTKYPLEVYGDPKIFDSPRLQFTWRPDEEKEITIWSMKLDGTDLRRVIEPKLLFAHGGSINHIPIRSPDNRYLAVSTTSLKRIIRILYDLKEKTSKIMAIGAYVPHFQWTDDSKKVLFYMEDGLSQYDVEAGKLSKMPMIYSQGLYIMRGKNRILAVRDYGFDIRDFNGKLIKKVKLVENPRERPVTQHNAASEDGELLLYKIGLTAYIIKTYEPDKPIYQGEDIYTGAIISPEKNSVYFLDRGIRKLDLSTGKIEIFVKLSGWVPRHFQIINTQSKRK